ncbi:MAG: T9SS type A sorting domain-containing protein [Clostridium sp.]|nr:T9SS type A sorting domain-containing protein [Clostridium sp.]
MKSKFYLFAGLSMIALTAGAQKLTSDYITWPNSSSLPTYINGWTPGQQIAGMEDENFFISRVKPKERIARNLPTQIMPGINDENDKKLLLWIPVGNTNLNGVHTDALPNGLFDSEVFSTWSYVTHYGDWTAPFGWVPGALADVAHKNGVAVSGVASIPNASLSGDWATCLTNLAGTDANKAAQFLTYHGVDGLGYNSEFGNAGSSLMNRLNTFHANLVRKMRETNPIFENLWYTGTDDNGSINFTDGLGTHNDAIFGDKDNERMSLFLNYNWNNTSLINTSISTASQLGRDLRDLYGGMNMQGGCKTSTEWEMHKTLNYSVGLWGAHDFNYFWAPRSQFGSTDLAKQQTYQKLLEWWFTNGNRNPIDQIDVYRLTSLGVQQNWFGMSQFLSARSSLGWDLDDEPFVTFFNLGNGRFLNWKGERQNDNEWYNIGVQDYLPTWRFWFANEFLGKEMSNVVANGLDAEFIWDDAWMGGSCLRVHGSSENEYLHLFKTAFTLKSNDQITVRYKLVAGKADISLALTDLNNTEALVENRLQVMDSKTVAADDEVWVEKTFKVTQQIGTALRNKTIAVLALHFQNAENMDLYLGEMSIKRGTYQTPNAPTISLARTLAYNKSGADAKVIFNMPNNKAAGEPCYNLDVNTSLFRIWSQQEGCEPVNTGLTTSWAAMVYGAPVDETKAGKIRYGIQAVSTDMDSESEIAWSAYTDCGTYTLDNSITIDKQTIKPGEDFTLAFADPKHEAETWTIYNRAGEKVFEQNGTSVTASLDQIEAYDLQVGSRRFNYYITVTAWEKGALPQIETLTINGSEEAPVSVLLDDELTFGYTGREADGIGSQAIEINEQFIGFPVKDVIGLRENFAVSAWIKLNYPSGSSRLFAAEDRTGSWPNNNWGWCWCDVDQNGVFVPTFRTNQSYEIQYHYGDDATLVEGAWTHLALCFETTGSKSRLRTFINGHEVLPTYIATGPGGGGTKVPVSTVKPEDPETWWISNGYGLDGNNWFSLGGGAGSEPKYNTGVIDDLTIWSGSITEEDAQKAYAGLDPENLPENVRCFWSFEDKVDVDNWFYSKGSIEGAKACNFSITADGGEGRGKQCPELPIYTTGSPMIDGTGFKVETVPTWTARMATIGENSGSDTEGSAKIRLQKKGDRSVTLTLSNPFGQDSRDYPLVTVADKTNAIAGIADDNEIEVYTVDDAIMITYPEPGTYTAAVYDIAGKLVAQRTAAVEADGVMAVSVRDAGVYLVNIVSGGRVIRSLKLIKQ